MVRYPTCKVSLHLYAPGADEAGGGFRCIQIHSFPRRSHPLQMCQPLSGTTWHNLYHLAQCVNKLYNSRPLIIQEDLLGDGIEGLVRVQVRRCVFQVRRCLPRCHFNEAELFLLGVLSLRIGAALPWLSRCLFCSGDRILRDRVKVFGRGSDRGGFYLMGLFLLPYLLVAYVFTPLSPTHNTL